MSKLCGLAADLAEALRRLAATPCVLAARDDDGQRVGMTATAVTALSLEPASLLLSVDRSRTLHRLLAPGRSFSVNLLDEGNADLCHAFAGRVRQAERFTDSEWPDDGRGTPYLAGAVSLSCVADAGFDYGTHTVFPAAVLEVRLAARSGPVAYADGALHRLAAL